MLLRDLVRGGNPVGAQSCGQGENYRPRPDTLISTSRPRCCPCRSPPTAFRPGHGVRSGWSYPPTGVGCLRSGG
jgi:hypothetical protein